MKSNPKCLNQKSPSREALLKAAAEQFVVISARLKEGRQDEVPDGWYTAKEIADAAKLGYANTKRKLLRMKPPVKKLHRLGEDGRMKVIPYYKLG